MGHHFCATFGPGRELRSTTTLRWLAYVVLIKPVKFASLLGRLESEVRHDIGASLSLSSRTLHFAGTRTQIYYYVASLLRSTRWLAYP